MSEEKESLRDKLIVVLVQTLIFGAMLAGLGYWFEVRLEKYKHELADQSERTKTLLASLEPEIQQRRAAYNEFLQGAREAKRMLELYYGAANSLSEEHPKRRELKALEDQLGLGSGGSGSSWEASDQDAIAVLNHLIALREKYQDASSDPINSVVDEFINTAMRDLKERFKHSTDRKEFDNSAGARVRSGFDQLRRKINQALGVDQLPVN